MKFRSWLVTGVVAVAFVSLTAAVGQSSNDTNNNTYQQLNLFGDVFEKIRSDYVEPVSDEKLIEAAINGMLTSLDPHSSYMNPKEWDDMQVQTKGEFGGLGIEVTMENGVIKVVSPIDDTPAAKAGIQPGDLIIQIDGKPIMGLTLSEAVDKMRGPVDSKIVLTMRRGKQPPFDVTLAARRHQDRIGAQRHAERQLSAMSASPASASRPTAACRMRIAKIKEKAGDKLRRPRARSAQQSGRPARSGDRRLRRLSSTRARSSPPAAAIPATPSATTPRAAICSTGLPIVVLINGGSASASEIVAGALQDHHRAILLGTRSFGKGSVQTIIPIPGHGAIRLTTARYYTPSGRSIQAKGIEPDIMVEQAKVEVIAAPQFRERSGSAGRAAEYRRHRTGRFEREDHHAPDDDSAGGQLERHDQRHDHHDGHLDARHTQRPGRWNGCGEA